MLQIRVAHAAKQSAGSIHVHGFVEHQIGVVLDSEQKQVQP